MSLLLSKPKTSEHTPVADVPAADVPQQNKKAFVLVGSDFEAARLPETSSQFLGPEAVCTALEILSRDGTEEVVLDFETTALTPWSAPHEPSGSVKIGAKTVSQWKKQSGATMNVTPRARVLSVHVPATDYNAAFDLDLLTTEDKYRLAAALNGKVWIGHNLGFDYQWMLTLNPKVRPARIIDTMLLTTACRPSAELEMQGVVVRHNVGPLKERDRLTHVKELEKYLTESAAAKNSKDKDDGAMPLKALSLWLLDTPMDKQYQLPHNWMIDTLTPAHYDYCIGDVEAPGVIARRLMDLPDTASLATLLNAIDTHMGGAAYRSFEAALPIFARMQCKGIGWSTDAAYALDAALVVEAEEAADALARVAPSLVKPISVAGKPSKKCPEPEPTLVYPLAALTNPAKGLSAIIKDAIAKAIFNETGRQVPTSDNCTPKLDAKSLAFDFPDSTVVKLLNMLQTKTKTRAMWQKYDAVAIHGRLHPLTGINTVTGRTSSQEPALQQVPRDKRFRAIFRAQEGYKILATDFSSIELRIAAALGVRAWREMQAIIHFASGDRGPVAQKAKGRYAAIAWLFRAEPDLLPFLQSVFPYAVIPERLLNVPQPRGRDVPFEDRAHYIAAELAGWIYKIRVASGAKEERLSFRAAYVGGLDPHLLTAIAMQAQGGHFDLKGMTPLAYLKSLSSDEAKALKHSMSAARQGAKAVNFGSLYGQQADGLHRLGITQYGLKWTQEEASAALVAWFDLYPEIGLWHWLLKYAHKVKANILNPYNSMDMLKCDEGGKVYQWYTLSGRETISSKLTSAANYQDQGTGAEIALNAITRLPDDIQDMLVNFVHDELVLEVPEDRIAEVQNTVERSMIDSADKLLMPFGIPTEVESEVGDCWIH